ncbi:protein EMSY-LIKE 4 isoform X1 [Prunus yedoensis var. nudiflora]|uniref:Protein EMSY-LIKE 4 isoform X1 n=1 Tax=Prunus yedoensis var. nudiflora TaxID=2094558 RepID=A0A314Z072_PRUYE|nr:protein EMSY-LIKE 4 isoform X1 [Prunus yedoensis var. nudiflora]
MGNYKHNHGIGSERMSPAKKPHGRDDWDIEFQIHRMEAKAYHAVLRAFSAQSNNLTWGREALMTELRKELNISDNEHGDLLTKIKSDEAIKVIREWRNDAHCAQECGKDAPRYPSKLVSNAQQREVETQRPPVSKSQKYSSCSQPCTEVIPSATAAPGAQIKDIGGMRVKLGRNFVTQGNSPFLNLKYQGELSKAQGSGDLAMLSSGNGRQSMHISGHNPQAPYGSRSTGLVKSQLKMGLHPTGPDNLNKSSDLIKIRATDKVLYELVPLHVEKAKLILKEHERAILEALGKLPDVSDVYDSPKQIRHKYPHEQLPVTGRKMLIRNDFYG